MKLEEKIIMLRKQNCMSQEELAYKLDVSRQAVSKWEMGSSTPDLDKIIKMSELFNVSTDYLLKDDEEKKEDSNLESIKRISKKEVEDYFNCVKTNSIKITIGVILCILSPICLLFLTGLASESNSGMTENFAVGIGLVVLFILVIIAVPLFIFAGVEFAKFNYIKDENIMLASDAKKYVLELKDIHQPKYVKNVTIGAVMCIASVIPLIIVSTLDMGDFIIICSVSLLMMIVAASMIFFIKTGNIQGCFTILLNGKAVSKENKGIQRILSVIASVFWLLVTALYLLISFLTTNWGITWIVWPIAVLVYAVIYIITEAVLKFKKTNV